MKDKFIILHIDDSMDFLEQFRITYSFWFDVASAQGAKEALELLEDKKFDAIILDYDMPDMDGLETLKILREKYPATPVLFYTGQGSEEVARQAFLEGASDYFVKDFELFIHKEKLVNSVSNSIEKSKVKEDLRKTRVMLEQIIELNPYAIGIWDKYGHFISCNKAHDELYKDRPDPKMNIFDHPYTIQQGYGPTFRKLREGKPARGPESWHDGHEFKDSHVKNPLFISMVGFPIMNEDNEVEKIILMHEDITARKNAEDALKKANFELKKTMKTLEQIIELNPYAIGIWDKDGHFISCNKAHDELFRERPTPELNMFDHPYTIQQGYGPFYKRIREGKAARGPEAWHNAHEYDPSHSDHKVCISVVGFPITNEYNKVEKVIVMHEDITARKNAEDALKKAHGKLKKSHEELERRVDERTKDLALSNENLKREIIIREDLQDQLRKKNRELEDFAYKVSHDIKNDLLTLKTYLELSKTEPEIFVQKRDSMFNSLNHLMEFVGNLLDLAKLGETIGEKEIIPVKSFVSSIFERSKPAGIDIQFLCNSESLSIPGDPIALEHVFSNLIHNSIKFRDPQKERLVIQIDCIRENNCIKISFKDNGVGIDKKITERIFDPLFTTRRGECKGLGLSIVKNTIKAHGGNISAYSPGIGMGTEFIIELPLEIP